MTTSVDALLVELAESGWQISWLFQFEPDHWRCTLVKAQDVYDATQWNDVTCFKAVADAPTLAQAIEECMGQMIEYETKAPQAYEVETKADILSLFKTLPKRTIARRL